MDRRELNREIFEDTERLCSKNERLVNSICQSRKNQYIRYENEPVEVSKEHRYDKPATIVVSKKRSLEAASTYVGKKVCVHNFASATNPGGGVVKGSSAQEEAICRCSTLYFNINAPEISNNYHMSHKLQLKNGKLDCTYNDDCVFTPGVTVFKSDDDAPKIMDEDKWYDVDIITCAAPNLRIKPSNAMNPGSGDYAVELSDDKLYKLHVKRIRRILSIAKAEGEEVVILGAFGCGAFMNNPAIVARAMKNVIDEFIYDFDTIELAVYCIPSDDRNFIEFNKIF